MTSFAHVSRFVADLFFPIECLGCSSSTAHLCDPCLATVPRIAKRQCPVCRVSSAQGRTCLSCASKTPLDGVFAAVPYKNRLIKQVIHTHKYRFVESLSKPLTTLLVEQIHNAGLPLPHVLVPVPLHRHRLRWRNFNQSVLLAQQLATQLTPGLPLPLESNSLVRIRATLPQARTISRTERLENLRGAFAWQPSQSTPNISGASIWLIDDVATTFATLEECARALKHAGAREVIGIVVAH